MLAISIGNLPNEIHTDLELRGARSGPSLAAEVRAILKEVVLAEDRLAVGSELVREWELGLILMVASEILRLKSYIHH